MTTNKTTEVDMFTDRPSTDRVPDITQDQIEFYMRRGNRIRSQAIARVSVAAFYALANIPRHAKAAVSSLRTIYRKPSHG
jgi:hypothetical protein